MSELVGLMDVLPSGAAGAQLNKSPLRYKSDNIVHDSYILLIIH